MPSAFSWVLTSPPVTTSPTGGTSARVTDEPASRVTIRGLLRPFVRDGVSDFASATGRRLIESKIGQIVGTRCSSQTMQGELPWRPEFGSLVNLVRHSNDDEVMRELARTYLQDALRQWLPSIRVSRIDVLGEEDTGIEGATTLRVVWKVTGQTGSLFEGTSDVALPATS